MNLERTSIPFTFLFVFWTGLSSAGEGLWQVGVAQVDITPDYPVRLMAYPTRSPEPEGVEQRLWAKALAIGSDSAGPAVLLTVEICGIPARLTEEVADRLRRKVGLVRRRFVVCSTHTHTGPSISGMAPRMFGGSLPKLQQDRIDRYTRELTDRLEKVSLEALADRKPGRLSWSVGNVGFAKNRRFEDGPVDHDLPLLRVTDTDGRLRAVLVSYACHCTDTGELEPVAGSTHQGRVHDDWGNWFGCDNSIVLWHYPLPDRYVRRNPHVVFPNPHVYVPESNRPHRLHPLSRTLTRFNNPKHYNRATSACSPTIYRDVLLGAEVAGDAFVCEPVHNLVTRLELEPFGVTFTGKRANDEQDSEFLASTDNWFRPVQVLTGPDGALWVVDMYRFVIEHPIWIPQERLAKLDVRAGSNMGRIFRVYPSGTKPRPIRNWHELPTSELCRALDSPNGTLRDLIQRELVHRGDKDAIGPLVELAHQSNRPTVRLGALLTLEGLRALSARLLTNALADPHPQVRRHAVRLSESFRPREPELTEAVLKLSSDPDITVRFQLALSLGEWHDVRAGKALGEIARKDLTDPYLAAAIMSSALPHLEEVLRIVLSDVDRSPPPFEPLEDLLRLAVAEGNEDAVIRVLSHIADSETGEYTLWQSRALAGLLDILERRGNSLTRYSDQGTPLLESAVGRLSAVFESARRTATDERVPEDRRLAAIRLLGRGARRQREDLALLAKLLRPRNAGTVQSAVVKSLGRLRDPRVPDILLEGWRGYGPRLRSEVLDVLFRRKAWMIVVLDAIEIDRISVADLDVSRRVRLLEHEDPDIRARAATLMAGTVSPDRRKVLEAYRPVLTTTGNFQRGEKIFEKTCSVCHRFRGKGHEVGPDLATLTERSASAILEAVLDPNKAVEPKYLNYTAATTDGLVLTGRLVEETGNSVALLGLEGKRHTILRTDLEALASSGKSLMPEGVEKDLKPQDLADIIAYLNTSGPTRKAFAGNRPELVRPDADGFLHLSPKNGEIYGTALSLGTQRAGRHKGSVILTGWNSEDDHAVWRLQVPDAGRYEVWLDRNCEADTAGNSFVLEVGDDRSVILTFEVAPTRDSLFRQTKVGEIELSPGQQRITLRSAGKISRTSFHLRSIILLPASS